MARGSARKASGAPQWKLWETTYDEDVAVEIPAGQHRIRIDNSGKDWVEVTRYTFTGCRVLDRPDVLVCGMKADDLAILWVQNKESCWHNHAAGTVGQGGRLHARGRGASRRKVPHRVVGDLERHAATSRGGPCPGWQAPAGVPWLEDGYRDQGQVGSPIGDE